MELPKGAKPKEGFADMAGQYKSVLEKYNETVKPRLPTAEEEAIQPDTTLESLLISPARAGLAGVSALKSGASKAKIPQIEIGSRVKAQEEAIKKWKSKYGDNAPNPFQYTAEEIAQGAKTTAKKTAEKDLDNAFKRSATGMGKNFSISAADTIRSDADKTTPMGDNFKKGGKVSASSRADGIAQRGKTKGRMC